MSAVHSLTLDFTRKSSDRMVTLPESVMTVQEVADFLRVNPRTVYRLAVRRKLPGFKVGTTWRFKRADIDDWIAAQSSCAHEQGEDKNT
jgi:excisionase family DNA binding protein